MPLQMRNVTTFA